MKKLKQMLFKLMSRTLSIKEFEAWLYNDEYIKSQLLENEMIFELLNIDLTSKHAFYELEKFCFSRFKKEECLIQVVRYNCEIYIEVKNDASAEIFFKNICYFYDWNDNYPLIKKIYNLKNDWDLALEGCIEKYHVKNDIFRFAQTFMTKLEGMTVKESIALLINGLEEKIEVIEESRVELCDTPNKKWFQFWK